MKAVLVEFERRTVGVAVRCRDGFWFSASARAFERLDGRTFPRLADLDRAVRRAAEPLVPHAGEAAHRLG